MNSHAWVIRSGSAAAAFNCSTTSVLAGQLPDTAQDPRREAAEGPVIRESPGSSR